MYHVCQAKFNLIMLWGNSVAEIEGWGQERRECRDGDRRA